ncbi:MAG: response regulator transcription factor [Chloroflexota bacterium]|nr:response regulator transcription factor [Chloroflexota bacterium]
MMTQFPPSDLINEVRTLVVADSPLARTGLIALLDGIGITVVGGVGEERDLLGAVEDYRPDVIIWDMGWQPLASLDRIADVRGVAALVSLSADHGTAIEAAPALLGAGVRGLLLQSESGEALCAALHAVAQGLMVVDPVIAAALYTGAPPNGDHAAILESLTTREMEVVTLIAEGLPNKTIARRLGISEHTVKFHVNAILTKLGAQSRTEAVVRATRLGLITL